MRNWIFLFIIVILGLLQATILDYISIFNVKPDLVLVSMVITSLYSPLKWALVLAVFAGLLKDALALNTFAINTLLFPLWSFLIIKLSKKISLDNNFIPAALIFVIIVSHDIAMRLLCLFLGQFMSLGIFLRTAFLEALYTALIFPLVFKLLKMILWLT